MPASTSDLPVINDLSTHNFSEFLPTATQNLYSFKAPLLGDGMMGFYAPKEGVNFFYLSCNSSDDFLIKSDLYQEDTIYFNYILRASLQMKSYSGKDGAAENLANRVLLIDNTSQKNKGLKLSKDEKFEFAQLSFKKKIFEQYFNRFMSGYSKKIQDDCRKSFYTSEKGGILIPFDIRQENCIRELINCPFDINLKGFFAELKTSELLLYYFQHLINGDLGINQTPIMTNAEKELIFEIKAQIDEQLNQEIELSDLCLDHNINERRLQLLFKSIFGISIIKYHKKQRLNKAYSMILDMNHNKNVKAIAHELGFSSVQSFSRVFFSEFKIRPSDVKMKLSNIASVA